MSDFETKLAEAEALIAAGIPTHWGKPFEDVVAIAREVVAEKDAEIARLRATLYAGLCGKCSRPRDHSVHVFNCPLPDGHEFLPRTGSLAESRTVTDAQFADGHSIEWKHGNRLS